MDINKTYVTSDHHFREWTHFGDFLCENTNWKPITLAEAIRQMDAATVECSGTAARQLIS